MTASDSPTDVPRELAHGPPAPHRLQARILGPVDLKVDGRPLPINGWPRRSARLLLLLLLATPGHRIARERAMDLLWPNLPADRVRNTWYQALSSLRQVLQPALPSRQPSAFLMGDAAVIHLHPELDLWIDADAFGQALRRVLNGSLADQREHLRAALALYRGDLLAEEVESGWAQSRRTELHLAWQRAVVRLAALDRQAGEPLASIEALQAVIDADRTAENAYRALIVAHIAAGEREEALRQYERCRQALRDDLDIEPDERTRALVESGANRAPLRMEPLPGEEPPPPRALPPAPVTTLVGREREVADVEELLWRPDVRLVTLTGPAGVGKTRLAMEVARRFDNDERAVAYVSLAGVRSPELVLPTIAQTLGVQSGAATSSLPALLRRIGEHELLLVLDNFEHVTPAATLVSRLLASCPNLRVLITSRVLLRLSGEHAVTAPPLALPAARRPTFAALARSAAVTLFVQRASAARSDFSLSEENAMAVAQLCARLDGLPLAIELAAARVRIMSSRAILARMEQRLDMLTGGPADLPARQRTMRAAIGWSHDLLDEPERALFRALAVFAGGISLPAARWMMADGLTGEDASAELPSLVATGPLAVPEPLVALADHSLLRKEELDDGEPRFVMLETVRDYAMEQLRASGAAEAAHRRHAAFLIAYAEAVAPSLTRTAQAAEVDRLALEIDNIRAALLWALDHGEGATAMRLATATIQLWFVRGMPAEGRHWLERGLAATPDAPDITRVEALIAAAALAFVQGDLQSQVAYASEALDLARSLGYAFGVSLALFQLGVAAEWRHDLAQAAAYYEEALTLMHQIGVPYWVALLLSNLGEIALWQGRLDQAEELAGDALERWRDSGNEWGIGQGLGTMAAIAAERGNRPEAARQFHEGLAIAAALGDRRGIAGALAGLAGLADAPRQAARLLGAARALGEAAGIRLVAHHLQFERVLEATRAGLDEREFDREWAAGQTLSLQQAIAEAALVAATLVPAETPGGDVAASPRASAPEPSTERPRAS